MGEHRYLSNIHSEPNVGGLPFGESGVEDVDEMIEDNSGLESITPFQIKNYTTNKI